MAKPKRKPPATDRPPAATLQAFQAPPRRTNLALSGFVALLGVLYYVVIVNEWLPLPTFLGTWNGAAGQQPNYETPPFEVARIPGKGMGLVATRDIEQGQLLIRENPLFIVPSQISSSPAKLVWTSLSRVSPAERDAFFNLSYVNFPTHLNPDEHPEEVALAIFQTNAVSAGDGVGIFPGMARLNHGCSSAFNSVYSWRDSEGALVVHALKKVSKGQELLTTYTDTKKPRDHRRQYLATTYGFDCTCAVCSLPPKQSSLSDQRLGAMADKYQRLASWGQGTIDGREAIKVVRQIWSLGEVEGYWSERGRLAADAAWVAAAHSDADSVLSWALLALRWYSFELGEDSGQAKEMISVVQRPQSHRAWGTRVASPVGGPSE